ncbi:DUF4920 domain-containing protein [Algoriphagus sp.]|uniref:DUF4920 domain-containing protein n=1 Tax=Algoriphagus sp. TaxID=1872435 RepID=UPI00263960AC|nr:DUF4920 domain-containing protein [Algoriphagus sp.]
MKKFDLKWLYGLGIWVLFACSTAEREPFADLESHEMGKVIGKAETVPGKYGDEMEGKILITHLPRFVEDVENKGFSEGVIQGEIKEVCASKGCWLTMDLPNGESMRVTFKNYGFFVPTNSQGFPVLLKGVGTLVETDVETLRHYAEDEGKSPKEIEAITQPKKEITFEAEAVIIPEKS